MAGGMNGIKPKEDKNARTARHAGKYREAPNAQDACFKSRDPLIFSDLRTAG